MRPRDLRDNDALFLDFDGTLVEITEHPEKVHLPQELPALLQAVSQRLGGALAMISGRRMADLDRWLQPFDFAGSGVHGIEIRRAPGAAVEELTICDLSEVARRLAVEIALLPGVWLEDKRRSLAIHFRAAPAAAWACNELATTVANQFGLQAIQGKMVVELKGPGTSKGTALSALMREPLFASRCPIYIGDDVSDEDGFAAAAGAGGFGIRVGTGATGARYRVADVPAAISYVSRILAKDHA